MGVPNNGWFTKGNPVKTDDFGVPPFQETSISPIWKIMEDTLLKCQLAVSSQQKYGCDTRKMEDLAPVFVASQEGK